MDELARLGRDAICFAMCFASLPTPGRNADDIA
jgi:hypothetical protein